MPTWIESSTWKAGADGLCSLGKGLDEKAVEALKKWVFIPAEKDGLPIESRAAIDFSSKLEKNPPARVRIEEPDKSR